MKPSRAMEPGGKKILMNFFTHWSLWRTVYLSFPPPPFFPVINIEYIFDQYIINNCRMRDQNKSLMIFFLYAAPKSAKKRKYIFASVSQTQRLAWLKLIKNRLHAA